MKFKKGIFSVDLNWFEEMEARIPEDGVHTRFAPSLTGYMYVDNLRTVLYTWLIARHSGGKFILRIEDTDQGRLMEGTTEVIYTILHKCGLTWDEGPDIGGPVEPYVQTERRTLYDKYTELLVERGHTYYYFYEKTKSGKDSGNFDRTTDPCRDMSLKEAGAKVAAGVPYVIRQKIPAEGSTAFSDAVFGDITVENSTLGGQVLIKRDGLPTYNFADVIDDHLMGIIHVVRGSEYLSSIPKYNLLYQGFGWDIPTYIHCSPVMRDAHNKMSKRKNDPSYEDLITMGYLSEAVVNHVTLLGWSPEGEYAEQGFFILAELAEIFDIGGISRSPAIFDIEKLTYFNAHYLQGMSPKAFHATALPYIRQVMQNPTLSTEKITGLLQARCERFTGIPERLDFFDTLPDYDAGLFANKRSKTNPEVSRQTLEAVLPTLERLADWTVDEIHDVLIDLAESLEVKNATLMWPVRIAAAGKMVTPGGAVGICYVLGKDECLCCLRLRLDKLGG